MNTWAQVDKLKDQESVNAKTLNRPVDQLASRTEYLKKRLGALLDEGVQSALILNDVDLTSSDPTQQETFSVGEVVYRGPTGFRKAQAKMSLYDDFKADDAAFTLGILVDITGDSRGDILIYGKIDLETAPMLTKSAMLQSGETFRSGRYYLSATEPGKITANPNGPLIYIGSFYSNSTSSSSFAMDFVGYVNAQFLDIGTSHVHRAYPLVARPAGAVIEGHVVGHLPIGALEGSSTGNSDSSSSSPEQNRYPSIVFSGTWTSDAPVAYTFTLSESSAWGSVTLSWIKNGNTTEHFSVNIPAPGVYVELDNGLKAKMLFPEATSSHAFSWLTLEERTWNLTFPDAGKGWIDHSIDIIASTNDYVPVDPCAGPTVPSVHALFGGVHTANETSLNVLFPTTVSTKAITGSTPSVTIDGTVYEFVSDGSSPSEGVVPVVRASTVRDTLLNLSAIVNESVESARVFAAGSTLVVCDGTLSGGTEVRGRSRATGFNIVGGTIPLMVVYGEDYAVIGDIIRSRPTYTPISLGDLYVTVYADGASNENNYACPRGTRLHADSYDYALGAKYDYVMGLHQQVDYHYPPVPAQAAGLVVNGIEVGSSALFPENPTYVIGPRTLHWMEDSEDNRPWPKNIRSRYGDVASYEDKTMAFYFIKGFQCATGPVTSLTPSPGSPIRIYSYGTQEDEATGDLMIDADLDLSIVDSGVEGYKVAKQGRNGKLLAGPVVERIKAGDGLVVTQEAGCPAGQGVVTINLDNGTTRGQFNEIALENAKQEKIGLFSYVSLLGWGESNNIPSAFTTMLRVPSNLDAEKAYKLNLRLVMFGTVGYSGTSQRAAGIQLEYNILPDYTYNTSRSLKTGLLIPDNPRRISVPFGHKDDEGGSVWSYTAYDPFVATTDVNIPKEADVCVSFSDKAIPSLDEFTVQVPSPVLRPGYLVAIRLSRIATPDGQDYSQYSAPVGFLSMEWTLQEDTQQV